MIFEERPTDMATPDLVGSSSGVRVLIRHRTRRADRFGGIASARQGPKEKEDVLPSFCSDC